jgi:hypothetical protein
MHFSHGGLPQLLEDMADLRRVGPVTILGLGALVYVSARLHNVWSYFVPSVIGPLLASVFLTWRPLAFLPRSASDEETTTGGTSSDERRTRFSALLKSRPAKWVVLRTGVSTSILTSLAMWLTLWHRSQSVGWRFDGSVVVPLTFLVALWSLTHELSLLLRWAFRSCNGGRRF